MEHNNSKSQVSSAESNFRDLINQGNDFYRIELLRQARNRYIKALELNIETDMVRYRIAECDRLLAFENKVVYILLSIATAILLVCIIVFR